MFKKRLLSRRLKKLFGKMNQGTRKDEGFARGIPIPEDIENGPGHALGVRLIFPISFAGVFAARSDRRHVGKTQGNFPMQMNIREHGLPSAGGGQLRKLIDQHLGKLPDLLVAHTTEIGGKKIIDSIPADDSGAVPLQHGPETDHVGQQDLGVFGRFGHRQGMRQIQSEFLEIFEGLAGAVDPVDKSKTVDMHIPGDMGVSDVLGKNVVQRVFPFDPLGQDQIRAFRTVGNIGALPVLQEDQLPDVIEGKTDQGMHAPGMIEPPLDQLRIHEFPDERGGEQADARLDDLLLHLAADRLRRIDINIRFTDQRLHNAPTVPAHHVLFRRPDK
jgi:hypothetical protein